MNILVLHSEPEELRRYLESELKGHKLHWASSPGEVGPQLEVAQPEVVFSIKHSQFPGPFHAQAFLHPTVRWFHVGGSGYDHLPSWNQAEKIVTNSAGILAPFHGERAMAALLAMTTGVADSLRAQSEQRWAPGRFPTLQGRNLLIVGYGATGRQLAKRAVAFGMRVVGVQRRPRPCEWAAVESPAELPDLWSQAQVLSLNLPLDESTHGSIGRPQLEQLPEGSFLLNASRGGVLCEESLLWALDEGPLSAAWLDVTRTEPLPTESPLWHHPKVLLTPHCADQVQDFPLRFARFFVENFRRFELGKPLERVVTSVSEFFQDHLIS